MPLPHTKSRASVLRVADETCWRENCGMQALAGFDDGAFKKEHA
jgi:hypothetical protein